MIGQQIEILNKEGGIVKTITIANVKYKEDGSILAVTDEEGNLYSEDELNLTYRLTPEYILYKTLCENNHPVKEWDKNYYNEIFKCFMNSLIKSGYVEQR